MLHTITTVSASLSGWTDKVKEHIPFEEAAISSLTPF